MGNAVCNACNECDSVADKINRDQYNDGAAARREAAARLNADAERYLTQAKITETNPSRAEHYRVKAHNCRVAAKKHTQWAQELETRRDRYDWEIANEQRAYPSDNCVIWGMVRACHPCQPLCPSP